MKIQFKEQDFQVKAVEAVVDCFKGQPLKSKQFTLERSQNLVRKTKELAKGIVTLDFDDIAEDIGYRNSALALTEGQLLSNIQEVQDQNELFQSSVVESPSTKIGVNLTIEMETGTGKTYTYIRTMYELYENYGWSKFIVIVPSIAIREGVHKSFEQTAEHFQELYGHKVNPFIYNSSIPQDIETFASDSRISVMIINTQAFNAKGKDARRIYMELDQFGSRRPIDIISQTNPIIIIDEPQSVEGAKTVENMQSFKPIITLRYSATHKKEYNKIYRLDALDAYNRKLVKKIQVKGINIKGSTGTSGYVYLEQILLSTNKPPVALIEYEERSRTGVKRVRRKLEQGADLFELSGEMPQYQNYLLQEIDGYFNKVVIGGQELFAGDVIGDVDEMIFRRIQIRETILSHIAKEKSLFEKGIKCLSLFFIDSVAKYRLYDDEGEQVDGEYVQIFEEEYKKIIKEEAQDLFISENYKSYLLRDDASRVHNGYFSVDKKNRMIDSKIKRGSESSDDISAYDLIMKKKEVLLDIEEPTRFIFSHSALKEGWDNPNVFQICALKLSDNTNRRRQEVGRGMRLSVNSSGVRQDFETIGEQVHELNKLTVIASESYEQFAKGLQKEIADTLKDRPQKAEVEYFVGKVITNEEGEIHRITEVQAKKLNKYLYKNDVIDEDDKLTEEGRLLIQENKVPLPEDFSDYRNSLTSLLKAIFTSEAILPENDRDSIIVGPNRNFHKKEFQELWNKINFKSIYEVQFNSEKLIADSKIRINADLYIADRSYEVKSGTLTDTTKVRLENREAFKAGKRSSKAISADIYTNTLYDIVGEIVQKTNLTRSTVVSILKSIKSEKFYLLRKNPEEFIAKCALLINEVKASLIINNIVYHKTNQRHEASTVFTNDKYALRKSKKLDKHIYDFLISDSGVEARFAEALENSEEVSIYAKLPKSFSIATPVARYSPDWAIVFDKDKVRQIYFIAETKGTTSELELRGIEKLKIHCATEHFKSITNGEVKFSKINTYENMLEIVSVK